MLEIISKLLDFLYAQAINPNFMPPSKKSAVDKLITKALNYLSHIDEVNRKAELFMAACSGGIQIQTYDVYRGSISWINRRHLKKMDEEITIYENEIYRLVRELFELLGYETDFHLLSKTT